MERLERSRIVGAAACVAVSLSGCGWTGPAHQAPTPGATAVAMGFDSYKPAEISIRAGDLVEWRNTSIVTHTVTADPKRAKGSSKVALPSGVEPFDSGDIRAGATFARRFSTAGTYRYVCLHHEGMVGTITVLPK